MEGVYGRSVVDYVNPGEARSGHRCGYCKSSDGRINNGEEICLSNYIDIEVQSCCYLRHERH